MKELEPRFIKKDLATQLGTPTGDELFETVVELTGLPQDAVTHELSQILDNQGCSSENLTLEDLRSALVDYLESLHQEMEGNLEPDAPH